VSDKEAVRLVARAADRMAKGLPPPGVAIS
jgi:hypothetical protein